MRGRKAPRPTTKVSVRLHADTLAKLRSYYPFAGYNELLRTLTDKHVRRLDARVEEKLSQQEIDND